MGYRQDLFKPPNMVSMTRLLMAPVLLYLAFRQLPALYLIAVCFTVLTDLVDGFLARTLHQITPLGSLLDSWGDFTVYSTMAICSWILWPATVMEHLPTWIVIVLSFTLPPLVGWIKFGGATSYHTWSVKLAVAVTLISYVLLFADLLHWPIDVAAFFCLLAATEEIAITLLLKHKRSDVRGVWKLFKE